MRFYKFPALLLFLVVQPSVAQTPASTRAPATSLSEVRGTVTVLDEGGVARKDAGALVVYLEGGPVGPAATAPAKKQAMSSHDKAFEPRVGVVGVGQAMSFPNLDDIMHNVFSLSKGNRFDLGLYKSGAAKDQVFTTPGLVRVYCNIHPQMSGFVHVLDSPHYAMATSTGAFRISDVPPGQYTLTVWHEEGSHSQPIIVSEEGASVRVELDVSGYEQRPHLNKFGKPYKRKRGKY